MLPAVQAGTSRPIGRLMVWETKGDHLGGKDTDYKRRLLQTISGHSQTMPKVRAGELELVFPDESQAPVVRCELVTMSEWRLHTGETLHP